MKRMTRGKIGSGGLPTVVRGGQQVGGWGDYKRIDLDARVQSAVIASGLIRKTIRFTSVSTIAV